MYNNSPVLYKYSLSMGSIHIHIDIARYILGKSEAFKKGLQIFPNQYILLVSGIRVLGSKIRKSRSIQVYVRWHVTPKKPMTELVIMHKNNQISFLSDQLLSAILKTFFSARTKYISNLNQWKKTIPHSNENRL